MSADRTTDLTAAAPSTFIPVATARHGLLPQRQSALSPRWRATGPARAVRAAIPSCRLIEVHPCFGDREPLSASIRAVGSQSSIVPSVIGNRSLQYHPLPVPCSRPHTIIEYFFAFILKLRQTSIRYRIRIEGIRILSMVHRCLEAVGLNSTPHQ